ncbi:MAG TPA: VWA domain-containing protein [Blastocatellia bacterium]
MHNSAPIARRDGKGRTPRFRCAFSISLLAVVCIITTSTLRAQGAATRTETFEFNSGGQVRVENARGATHVEVWEDQTVRVVAEKRTPAGASLDANELVLMSIQNTVYVQCKQSPRPGRIDLTVYVPRQSHLRVTGGTWPVEVNGSLASAVVETISGAIAYRLPGDDDARIAMRSSRGVVRSNVALVLSERTGTQVLQGQLGSGSASILLSSLSGNVTLTPGPKTGMVAKMISDHRSAAAENMDDGTAGTASRTGQSSDATQRGNARHKIGAVSGDQGEQQGDRQTANDANAPPSPARPLPRNTSSTPASGNGSSVFAGGDRSDDASLTVQGGGPFVRPREERRTSGGSSGLKVRIIPSGRPLNDSQDNSSPTYDTQDEDARSSQPTPQNGAGSRADRSINSGSKSSRDNQSDVFSPRRRPSSLDQPAGDSEELSSSAGRSDSPPVLARDSARSPRNTEPESPGRAVEDNPGDEAVVLKAALVNLNVSVTNRSGVALANLKKEDFEVAENGEQQRVEFFQTTTAPFNLVLVLDLSGSIKDKLDVVKSAALRFLEVIGPQDKVAVVAFTHEIKVVSQLTSDRNELRRRIKAIERPEGGTAFYEAMWFSLADTLRGTRGQRNAIVVMTDGVDSSLDRYNPASTRVSFNQLAQRLEESDTLVFPVYLDTEYEEVFERGNSSSEAYAVARDQLDRLAELTGGQKFRAEKVGDLSGVYKQVAAAIRTVYSVGYYPSNAERDGTYRRVRVSVNRPEAAVRTRKGYYAR